MDWVKRSLFVHVGLSLGVGALAPLGCDAGDDGSPPRKAEQPEAAVSEDLEVDGPIPGEDAEGHPCDTELDERVCDDGRQFCAKFEAGLEWGHA